MAKKAAVTKDAAASVEVEGKQVKVIDFATFDEKYLIQWGSKVGLVDEEGEYIVLQAGKSHLSISDFISENKAVGLISIEPIGAFVGGKVANRPDQG